MKSLLYVSRRRANAEAPNQDVDAIVSYSRDRNANLDLTGALVATPNHFAQILEGPSAAIDDVMASIIRDGRHFDIMLAPVRQRPRREFDRWSLAYSGESSYVSGLIANTLDAPHFELMANAENIRDLMAMLA
jgi:hypothetical protein